MSDRELRPFNNTRVTTSGNLAADPRDISRDQDGSVAVFNLFVNRRDNNGDEFSDVYNCKSISASMSENILASLRSGMAVEVEGKLEISWWENKDGEEQLNLGLLLDRVDLPLKYRSLQDHVDKFEEKNGGSSNRRKSKGRARDDEDTDDTDDDDEEETPSRSRRGRSSRSSGGTTRSSRSRRASSDDDDDEATTKTRRSRRSTRTRGDSDDEDDEI